MIYPFNPVRGGTVTLSPSAGSVNSSAFSTGPAQVDAVMITNAGTELAFVRIQNETGAVDASTVDVPVMPGASGVLRVGQRSERFVVSAFCAAATTIYVVPGTGGV